jgi:hypothetical protein
VEKKGPRPGRQDINTKAGGCCLAGKLAAAEVVWRRERGDDLFR